jgi:hypothetical protein
MPPIIFFTGRCSVASLSAALSAPLQCGPAQYTTNSVPSAALGAAAGRETAELAGRAFLLTGFLSDIIVPPELALKHP